MSVPPIASQNRHCVDEAKPREVAYAGLTDAERGMRATEILAIVRRLEGASLDELLVVGIAIARLESLRGRPAGPSAGIAESLIDRALRLELCDTKLTREILDAQHDADRAAMVPSTPPLSLDRLARARINAGLTQAQASRMLSYDVSRIEDGRDLTSIAQDEDMAAAYGVTIDWLRGTNTPLPPETVAMLRDADISTDDRASLTDLLESVHGRATTPDPAPVTLRESPPCPACEGDGVARDEDGRPADETGSGLAFSDCSTCGGEG